MNENIKDYFNFITSIPHPYKDASLDFCHTMLLFGTVLSKKPNDILELGIGPGVGSLTILAALMYNEKPFNYLTVDNMYDLGGNLQQGILDLLKNSGVKLEISNEKEFLDKCPENSYDMCVSDADHINGGENVEKILRAVRNNGIIFAHDICNEGYPSLRRYIEVAQNLNLPHYVFNEKSLSTEGCNTGFIMIINKK